MTIGTLASSKKTAPLRVPAHSEPRLRSQLQAGENANGALGGRCACGGGCPLCRAPRQAEIEISTPGDYHELEADRAADAIAASGREKARPVTISRATSPSVMRFSHATGVGASPQASIRERIASTAAAGSPLPNVTRARIERGLNADLAAVRIHADSNADRLSRDLGASAFTHGSHIYFRRGEYRPGTPSGDWLIAHESAHVLQQRFGRRPFIQRQLSGCSELMASTDPTTYISGQAVHAAIAAHFLETVVGATPVAIPGASAGPLRSQGICGDDTPVINPQRIGGAAGMGYPDLAAIGSGGVLQVAEVKPAALPCLVDGEDQLLRYIDQGNAQDAAQIAWRAGLGVSVVSPMLERTYPAPELLLPGFQIMTAWCTPGLLAYSVRAVTAPPIPVFKPAEERERRTVRESDRRIVVDREPVGQRIAQWARQVYEEGRNASQAAEEFLHENPALVGVIVAAGIAGIVLLIADDATIAGIIDDVLIPIIAALEWVALRTQFAY